MAAGPRLVCLLPTRNAAADLPELLEGAEAFCDAIVALDDGSTDDTRAILEANPLVEILLSNPPRGGYVGWHDGNNRNRLLAASVALEAGWIISVDADERIDPDDAAALRAFVESDAVPGLAYGLQHLRMWGADRYDPRISWVYRLFAFSPGQEFPAQRLHFDPVPTSIPRNAWVRTSIRVRHLGAADEERMLARLARYREVDPDGEYRTDFGGLDRPPSGELLPWGLRDPQLPIIVGSEEGAADGSAFLAAPPATALDEATRPTLVCLLPARNCEEDLPGYFDSVRRFADAVVALDDGSTDGTGDLLAAEPLVTVLLSRPRRSDYRGWDDAANRRMLLEAAGSLNPRWIISLDADERIDADDGRALREFVEREADPENAYGFRVYRMVGDGDDDGYDLADLWVGRLFAYRPGQSFPDQRLHFVPIPTSIARDRWVGTTVRIRHFAGSTEERRRARYAKYAEADPEHVYQRHYGNLLEQPGPAIPWEPRPPGLPVIAERESVVATGLAVETGGNLSLDDVNLEPLDTDAALDGPVLSAIVISRDDEQSIEQVVRSIVEQECPEPFEVIVVTSGTDRTADIVRGRFPEVTLVELPRPALPGEARNAGLSVARGDYVSFPGSHVLLPQGSLAARIRAHELGYPMVTGTTLNGNPTASGWASYFLDHSTVLPGRPSGELTTPPPHCSYDRDFLLKVGGFPEDMRAGEDTVVNLELGRRGYRPYRAQDVTLIHRSPCSDPVRLLRHHFLRGRALGRIMIEGRPPGVHVLDRATLRRVVLGYLPIRLRATSQNVRRWGGTLGHTYRRVLPLVAAGAAAAWGGTLFELFRPAPGKLDRLVGRPARTLALIGLDRQEGYPIGRADVILLARVTLARARASAVALPRDLLVEIPGAGTGRLNEAYFAGARQSGEVDLDAGMRLLARTIERALRLRVHGTVAVDFDGFRRVVDAMGGLEIDVPHDIDDEFIAEDGEHFSAHFAQGRQRLGGEEALSYARTRGADGDAWRRRRHIDLALALVGRARSAGIRGGLRSIVRAARGSIRTTLSPATTLAVAQAVVRLRRSGIATAVLKPPLVKSERTADGKWVHRGHADAIALFVREGLFGELEGRSVTAARAARVRSPRSSSGSSTRRRRSPSFAAGIGTGTGRSWLA